MKHAETWAHLTRAERIAELEAELARLKAEPRSAGEADFLKRLSCFGVHPKAWEDLPQAQKDAFEAGAQAAIDWHLENTPAVVPDSHWREVIDRCNQRIAELEAKLVKRSPALEPDRPLARGDVLELPDGTLEVIWCVQSNNVLGEIETDTTHRRPAQALEARKRWEARNGK